MPDYIAKKITRDWEWIEPSEIGLTTTSNFQGTANEIDVTVSAPNVIIGLVNPVITGKGGTGLAASGTTQYVLTSNGSIWTSADPTANELIRDLVRYVNDRGSGAQVNYVKSSSAPTGALAAQDELCLRLDTAELYIFDTGSWNLDGVQPNGSKFVFRTTGTDTSGASGTHTADNKIYTSTGSSAAGVAAAYRDVFHDGTLQYFNGTSWVSGLSTYFATANTAIFGTARDLFRINALASTSGDLYFGSSSTSKLTGNSDTGAYSITGTDAAFSIPGANAVFTLGAPSGDGLAFGAAGTLNGTYGLFSNDLHALQQLYASRGIVCGLGRQYLGGVTGAFILSTAGLNGVPTVGSQIMRAYTNTTGAHFENHFGEEEGSVSQKFFFDDVVDADDYIATNLTATTALYSDANKKITSVTANATATNKFLRQVSSGTPSFEQVAFADLSGNATVAQGGTGLTTITANTVPYGNGTGNVQLTSVNATATNKFLRQVSSGAPSFQQVNITDLVDYDLVAYLSEENTFTAKQTVTQLDINGAQDAGTATILDTNSVVAVSSTSVATTDVIICTYKTSTSNSYSGGPFADDIVASTGFNIYLPNGGVAAGNVEVNWRIIH